MACTSVRLVLMQDFEVYDVGKRQLWDWCDWSAHGYLYGSQSGNGMITLADSLRRGVWVLVGLSVGYGSVGVPVASFSGSRRAVLELAETEVRKGLVPAWTPHGWRVTVFEVWHVVDDGDLWDDWERRAYHNQLVTCEMCGHESKICDCYLDVVVDSLGVVCRECEYSDLRTHPVDADATNSSGEHFGLWTEDRRELVRWDVVPLDCDGNGVRDSEGVAPFRSFSDPRKAERYLLDAGFRPTSWTDYNRELSPFVLDGSDAVSYRWYRRWEHVCGGHGAGPFGVDLVDAWAEIRIVRVLNDEIPF